MTRLHGALAWRACVARAGTCSDVAFVREGAYPDYTLVVTKGTAAFDAPAARLRVAQGLSRELSRLLLRPGAAAGVTAGVTSGVATAGQAGAGAPEATTAMAVDSPKAGSGRSQVQAGRGTGFASRGRRGAKGGKKRQRNSGGGGRAAEAD